MIKIISGGQTGVDRAALDVALKLDIPIGGWCPKGRKAEDGPISSKYPLKETPNDEYVQRTEWNARDSDGTLILTWGEPTGGTQYTIEIVKKYQKPFYMVDLVQHCEESAVRNWIKENNISVLNVAGPRGSKGPQIYRYAEKTLTRILSLKM